jgi:hypothetical protein
LVKGALQLLGLPIGDPRPPIPHAEITTVKEVWLPLERFHLRERYGL